MEFGLALEALAEAGYAGCGLDEWLVQFNQANRGAASKLELTAEGVLLVSPMQSKTGSRLEMIFAGELYGWAREHGGEAHGSRLGVHLPNGARYAPDAAWLSPEQLADYSPSRDTWLLHFCPHFVAEVMSRHDRPAEARRKMDDYIAHGARLGWLIDPFRRQVHIYLPERRTPGSGRPRGGERRPGTAGLRVQHPRAGLRRSVGRPMTTATTVGQKLWNYCDVLRNAGLSYGDYLEQLTYLIFLKMMHELTQPPFTMLADHRAAAHSRGLRLAQPAGAGRRGSGSTLPRTLETLSQQEGTLGVIFSKAQSRIQEPAMLTRLVKELIDSENWHGLSADVKGDAYESLLERNAQDVKTGAGQYFTPRPAHRSHRGRDAARAGHDHLRPGLRHRRVPAAPPTTTSCSITRP
ncbi:Probable type I restriction enzyme BthVORF4518P M protein [Geodia barretti]|uniref:site-specific DNA-methyltransferase (adenine-specific) n=1 Tax=Geodia barretti TaxID=519541 RepID=A0AA35RZY1_GEOBA|nr:Probable type I restriction enzyme BthVORF4518P M protein [Geodia barretti]